MFNFFKKIFSNKEEKPSINHEDERLREIISNRYPPYDEGFVVSSGEELLNQHKYLISRIKFICGFNDEDFERYYMPVMKSYAEFVQLLPASQRNHHKGAGGLLRHGLEVAHYSLESSYFKLFAGREPPELKRVKEGRWRYATFVAGLLHDVGKPVSDIEVIDKDGKSKWNPYESTISQWAEKNHIKRYYVVWNKKRVHKEHEVFSGMVSNMLIPSECMQYISDGGVEISSALFRSIGGINNPNDSSLLGDIVKKSDSLSTEIDLKENGDVGVVSGTPVERHIIDTIRELIDSDKYWKPNASGSRLWKTKQGLFVIWSSAVDDIKSMLKENNVPGIPQNKNTLAEILVDHGYAEKFINEDGSEKLYWLGTREIKGISKKFSLLKLAKVSSLIEDIKSFDNCDMLVESHEEVEDGSNAVEPTQDKKSLDAKGGEKTDKNIVVEDTANVDADVESISDGSDDFENEMMKEFNKTMDDESEDYNYSSEMEKTAHTWLLKKGHAGVLLDSVLSSIKEESRFKVGTKGVVINNNLLSFHVDSDIYNFSGTNYTEFSNTLTKSGFLYNEGRVVEIKDEKYISLNTEVSLNASKYIGYIQSSKNQEKKSISLLAILKEMFGKNELSLLDMTYFDGSIYLLGNNLNFVSKILDKNPEHSRKDIRNLINGNFEEVVSIKNPVNGKEVKAGKYCGESDLREIKKILKNKVEKANG